MAVGVGVGVSVTLGVGVTVDVGVVVTVGLQPTSCDANRPLTEPIIIFSIWRRDTPTATQRLKSSNRFWSTWYPIF